MNRVCKAGKFDKYKQKTGYRTAQHFADDDGMYVTSAHSFYRSLFMTREKKNKNLFISSIGFELFIVEVFSGSHLPVLDGELLKVLCSIPACIVANFLAIAGA